MRSPAAFDLVQPLKVFLSEITAAPLQVDDCVGLVRRFMDQIVPMMLSSPLFQVCLPVCL